MTEVKSAKAIRALDLRRLLAGVPHHWHLQTTRGDTATTANAPAAPVPDPAARYKAKYGLD